MSLFLANDPILRIIHKRPGFIISALGIYLGAALIYFQTSNYDLKFYLQQNSISILGGFIILVSLIYFVATANTIISKRERQFIDIDDKAAVNQDNTVLETLVSEIDKLKKSQPTIDYNIIEELIKQKTTAEIKPDLDALKSFEGYFNIIRTTLEEKAAVADQKASILLDKGTAYSKGGITFFIASIIAWQSLSWIKGFEIQFIYGIVSCSILFIFIEFLSAWFLKQYRQFVDTSTYLIKVKSIFDRYMLAYLLLKEASGDQKEKLLDLIPLLKEDIKWPETYLLKNGDVSFAKETMETMTYLLKNMKESAKADK